MYQLSDRYSLLREEAVIKKATQTSIVYKEQFITAWKVRKKLKKHRI